MDHKVKAYLQRTDGEDKIRHFSLALGTESGGLEALSGKLAEVFPRLSGKSLVINARDTNEDDTLLTSDQELLDAASAAGENVLTIVVKVESDDPQEKNAWRKRLRESVPKCHRRWARAYISQWRLEHVRNASKDSGEEEEAGEEQDVQKEEPEKAEAAKESEEVKEEDVERKKEEQGEKKEEQQDQVEEQEELSKDVQAEGKEEEEELKNEDQEGAAKEEEVEGKKEEEDEGQNEDQEEATKKEEVEGKKEEEDEAKNDDQEKGTKEEEVEGKKEEEDEGKNEDEEGATKEEVVEGKNEEEAEETKDEQEGQEEVKEEDKQQGREKKKQKWRARNMEKFQVPESYQQWLDGMLYRWHRKWGGEIEVEPGVSEPTGDKENEKEKQKGQVSIDFRRWVRVYLNSKYGRKQRPKLKREIEEVAASSEEATAQEEAAKPASSEKERKKQPVKFKTLASLVSKANRRWAKTYIRKWRRENLENATSFDNMAADTEKEQRRLDRQAQEVPDSYQEWLDFLLPRWHRKWGGAVPKPREKDPEAIRGRKEDLRKSVPRDFRMWVRAFLDKWFGKQENPKLEDDQEATAT